MLVWILLPVFNVTVGYLSSDVIDGTCIPWGASNYATPLSILTVTYLTPLLMILFCYTRIVYKIKRKVTLDLMTSNFAVYRHKSKNSPVLHNSIGSGLISVTRMLFSNPTVVCHWPTFPQTCSYVCTLGA